jgi:hypothetical protein
MMERLDTHKKGIKKVLTLIPIFGLNICVTQFSFTLNPLHLSPNQIESCTNCIGKESTMHVLKEYPNF